MLQEIELLQKLHGIGRVFDLVDTAGIEEIKNNEIQEIATLPNIKKDRFFKI